MTLCYQSSDMTKFDQSSDFNLKFSDIMSGYFLIFGKQTNMTQYHQKSYMTCSDIESELEKLPNLTHYCQKSYMTFSEIESELRKLPNLTHCC